MGTRRVEEMDEDGRRTVTTYTDDTPVVVDNTHVANEAAVESVGEDRVVHDNPFNLVRGFIMMLGALAFAALTIVETGLGFRLGFLAAGSNPTNGFVDFIYDSTNWLVEPFGGIVTNEAVNGGGTFESATLIAMIVYAVAFFLFAVVLWAITSFPSPGGERTSVTRTATRERTAHEH